MLHDSPRAKRTSHRRKGVNPFYVLLLFVGTLFVITCFAYFVMTLNQMKPAQIAQSQDSSLIRIMERDGLSLLVAELVVLAICTFAAIATDDFWTRLEEKRKAARGDATEEDGEEPPGSADDAGSENE